jgi:hypothetical protein
MHIFVANSLNNLQLEFAAVAASALLKLGSIEQHQLDTYAGKQ